MHISIPIFGDTWIVSAAASEQAYEELYSQGFDKEAVESTLYLNLRYQGTDTAVMLAQPPDNDFEKALGVTYLREYGFDLSDRPIIIDDIRIRAVGKTGRLRKIPIAGAQGEPSIVETENCYFEEGWRPTPIYRLETLAAGHHISGPAILTQDTTTIVVEPDCAADITETGDVAIQVHERKAAKTDISADPIRLSIFSNLFMSIAEQMGRMLQKTAISTNIKERLDFSCALFGPGGELVANAPHVPVHLGAMSEAVKGQIRLRKNDIHPGDVLVSNHPAAGGSHLQDITVMTPVFEEDAIIFWVAARGHHADIGGISPGSMPPDSISLEEEGACIESFKLVENGRFREEEIRKLLLAPGRIRPRPGRPEIAGTRNIKDTISDLHAQVAANRKGIELVEEMIAHYGLDVVQAYMKHVQDAAEAAIRDRLRELSLANGMAAVDTVQAVDYLDDGSPIALALTIDREKGSAVFDFSGTGPKIKGNLNTPQAVTASAVLYGLRCLIQKELPLNHGCLIPIEISIPKGSLLDPSPKAAVVGGNVLTSQRIVDVVLKAFNVAAASQGCMNNFTWGITGPGTIGAVENIPGDWDLSYSLNPAGYSTVQWNVTSSAAIEAGDYEFDWNYSGFHSWFAVTAFLNTSEGTTLVNVGPGYGGAGPSGGFSYSGSYTFAGVSVGDTFGFAMGGSNVDAYNIISGTLNLQQQQPVPEPATMFLLGVGLVGLAGIRRRLIG